MKKLIIPILLILAVISAVEIKSEYRVISFYRHGYTSPVVGVVATSWNTDRFINKAVLRTLKRFCPESGHVLDYRRRIVLSESGFIDILDFEIFIPERKWPGGVYVIEKDAHLPKLRNVGFKQAG